MEMEFTSTPEDLMAKEAAEVGQQLMDRDEHMVPTIDPRLLENAEELYSPLHTPATSSSSLLRPKRLRDLKVEVPLVPADPIESSTHDAEACFPTGVQSLIPPPDSDTATMDKVETTQDLEDFVSNAIAPLAEPSTLR